MSVTNSRDDCQHPVKRIQVQADKIFPALRVRDLHIDHALVLIAVKVRAFQEHPGAFRVRLGHPRVVKAIDTAKFDPNAGKYMQPEDDLNRGR